MPKVFLTIASYFVLNVAFGQCPDPDFVVPSEACVNEVVQITNNSLNAETYNWDFCAGGLNDFVASEVINEIVSSGLPLGISTVSDGEKWHTFFTNRSTNKLYRIDHGESLDMVNPNVSDLGNVTGGNLPDKIKIFQEEGNWYGLLTNDGAPYNLIKLDFGTSLFNQPNMISLGSDFGFDRPRGLDIAQDNGDLIAVVSNRGNNTLTLLNFGTSINNILTPTDIISSPEVPESDGLFDLKLVKHCDEWYAFTVSVGNGGIHRISFGMDLFSLPTAYFNIEPNLTNNIDQARSIELKNDGVSFKAFVVSIPSEIVMLDFGQDITNDMPLSESLGSFTNGENIVELEIEKQDSGWVGLTINFDSRELIGIEFSNECGVNELFSEEENPKGVFYVQPGTYDIGLVTLDGDSNVSFVSRQIVVSENEAPVISQSTDNLCVSSSNTFTSTNNSTDQTITSWTWDFGDGSTTATGESVTHQYAAAGIYEVMLSVESDNSCGQIAYDTITIYEEPIPDFGITQTVICTNSELNFENLTPGDFGDDISWSWDFGDGTVSTGQNPTHEFADPGDYDVVLTAMIPGCAPTITQTISVIAGPLVAFDMPNVCDGTEIAFTDQTTGDDITGYFWDFGDGSNSTLQNPNFEYAEPGSYNVSLTVDNGSGCSNTFTQEIIIYEVPQVDFLQELACSGTTTQFTDQTTVGLANITAWEWDFGDGSAVSNEQNPLHTFAETGQYTVNLTATSNFGCSSSFAKEVDVIAAPEANFTFSDTCLGQNTLFQDASTTSEGEDIISWFWQIDDQVYSDQNPQHTFAMPGTFQATLTITSSTFCVSTITQDIVVNDFPEIGFSFTLGCTGSETTFVDETVQSGSPIISRLWDFGGLGSAEGETASFTFVAEGAYTVALTVETESGCIVTTEKQIDVFASPVASFSIDADFGAPPLNIGITNTSSNADSYTWFFNDLQSTTSTEFAPNFAYPDLGSYEIVMIANTASGCTDTARATVNVVDPVLDIRLDQLTPVVDDGNLQILISMANKGTVLIDDMDIFVELGDAITLKQSFEGTLAADESITVPVSFEVSNAQLQNLAFVCVSLAPNDPEYSESAVVDNELCADLAGGFTVRKPYPNPTDKAFNLEVVLPESGVIQVELLDSRGVVIQQFTKSNGIRGLNEFSIATETYGSGVYLLRVSHNNSETLHRIVIQH